jgi:hypothetical protein
MKGSCNFSDVFVLNVMGIAGMNRRKPQRQAPLQKSVKTTTEL